MAASGWVGRRDARGAGRTSGNGDEEASEQGKDGIVGG